MRRSAGQPLWQSVAETAVNYVIGFAVALGAQVVLLRHFHASVSAAANVQITLVFTLVSIIRSFFLRRLFNLLHVRSARRQADPAEPGKSADIINLESRRASS